MIWDETEVRKCWKKDFMDLYQNIGNTLKSRVKIVL